MREIVHLQAGQCGNQIGSKVRELLVNFVCVGVASEVYLYLLVLMRSSGR